MLLIYLFCFGIWINVRPIIFFWFLSFGLKITPIYSSNLNRQKIERQKPKQKLCSNLAVVTISFWVIFIFLMVFIFVIWKMHFSSHFFILLAKHDGTSIPTVCNANVLGDRKTKKNCFLWRSVRTKQFRRNVFHVRSLKPINGDLRSSLRSYRLCDRYYCIRQKQKNIQYTIWMTNIKNNYCKWK